MASDANGYPIYLFDRDGGLVAKLDDTDSMGKCLIEPADIVRAILKTDPSKSALAQMAAEFSEYHSTAWFLQEEQGTQEEKTTNVVCGFRDLFQGRRGFPSLCPSEPLRLEDIAGVTHRYPQGGRFLLSSERMVLNGLVSRKPTRFRCSLAS